MKIKGLRWGSRNVDDTATSYAAELAVADKDGKAYYIACALLDNREGIAVTDRPLTDGAEPKPIENYEYEINAGFSDDVFSGSRFFAEIRFARFALERYLEYDVEPEPEEAAAFIAEYLDRDASEFDVPTAYYGYADIEEDTVEFFDDDYSALIAKLDGMKPQEIMARRLSAEEAVKDSPDDGIGEYIEALREHCGSEAAYRSWKESYIRANLEAMRGKTYYAVEYIFGGFDRLKTVFPEEQLGVFRQMAEEGAIEMLSEPRPATETELIGYISLHADDEV